MTLRDSLSHLLSALQTNKIKNVTTHSSRRLDCGNPSSPSTYILLLYLLISNSQIKKLLPLGIPLSQLLEWNPQRISTNSLVISIKQQIPSFYSPFPFIYSCSAFFFVLTNFRRTFHQLFPLLLSFQFLSFLSPFSFPFLSLQLLLGGSSTLLWPQKPGIKIQFHLHLVTVPSPSSFPSLVAPKRCDSCAWAPSTSSTA